MPWYIQTNINNRRGKVNALKRARTFDRKSRQRCRINNIRLSYSSSLSFEWYLKRLFKVKFHSCWTQVNRYHFVLSETTNLVFTMSLQKDELQNDKLQKDKQHHVRDILWHTILDDNPVEKLLVPFLSRSISPGRKRPYPNHLRRKPTAVYSDRLRQWYTTFYDILRLS